MKLYELFHGMRCSVQGDDEVVIRDLQYDSRTVRRGDLFFCISGFQEDGHRFAMDAVQNGAVAIVVTEPQVGLPVTQVVVPDSREAMAVCACRFFGFPARRLQMVGVTGTNGKTTTTYMMKSIMEKAGKKVGLIGTIVNMIGDRNIHTERTTPEAIDLQRLLKYMVEQGCDACVMEVSSHALALKRVHGIRFDVGIFTNQTQDHLDFHHTWDEYVKAKSVLFSQSKISVINIDDDSAANMIGAAMSEVITFSVTQPAMVTPQDIRATESVTIFDVELRAQTLRVEVPIPGMFTVYNALGAVAAASALDIIPLYIEQGLKEMQPVAGRFEPLPTHGKNFSIILDYSHTPDSLENALNTVRQFARGRVVTIFGCGGNRDAIKRPVMGRIAGELSDYTIITSDNPRYENPLDIMAEIEAGIAPTGAYYICIESRRDAIAYAMAHARAGDVILLAGKGHEDYQEVRGKKYPFDEKIVVEELFEELFS